MVLAPLLDVSLARGARRSQPRSSFARAARGEKAASSAAGSRRAAASRGGGGDGARGVPGATS